MFITGKELNHQDPSGITATSQLNPPSSVIRLVVSVQSLGRKTRERDVLIKARGAGPVKDRLLLLPEPSKTEGTATVRAGPEPSLPHGSSRCSPETGTQAKSAAC